jgi:hypothetical protein
MKHKKYHTVGTVLFQYKHLLEWNFTLFCSVQAILHLGDKCIVFENFTTSIGDLMVAN